MGTAMTLENLYLIAQIIAALAIVSSLMFVGLQIKAGTAEQRLQRIMERAELVRGVTNHLLYSPDLRRVILESAKLEFRTLTPEDAIIYSSWVRQYLQMQVILYSHIREGQTDDPTLYGIQNASSRALTSQLFLSWWDLFKSDYSPEILAYMDNAIARGRRQGKLLPQVADA